jgi:methylated-DNA-[protein]-cysteine S-methyltransferase
MSQEHIAYYKSEIGTLKIMGTEKGITFVGFVNEVPTESPEVHSCIKECMDQIDDYFKGNRKQFDLKLDPHGTDFQKQVWDQLMKVPYGVTSSYKDIATAIGNEKAIRAVGSANGKNDIVIIIPCHRIIGSDGTLVGYGSGLDRKQWLLDHEAKYTID